jgi:serine protease inhibitor
MVLANAIYFKGEWSSPFNANQTQDGKFLLADGSSVETKLMKQSGLQGGRYGAFEADGAWFRTPHRVSSEEEAAPSRTYPSDKGFTIAELPYKGAEVSMVLVAPRSPAGLPAIENIMSVENLNQWLGRLEGREMEVVLPKLKLETNYLLEKSLWKMGMTDAFAAPGSPGGADFSGIHRPTTPQDGLFISKVLHKAFLEVDEKGTEAAAATAVLVEFGDAKPESWPFHPSFKADRPFLLLIRHKATGAILFMGRVNHPAATTGSSDIPDIDF